VEHVHTDCLAVWRGLAVRTLSCAEQYRAMAFAQLTYRRACATSRPACRAGRKLYAMGSATRCDARPWPIANEARDWRIYAELAQRLIVQARRLYTTRSGFRPRQYGLCARLDDHRSLSGRLSVGAFPHDKAAVKMHTLLDLRGNIPSFIQF